MKKLAFLSAVALLCLGQSAMAQETAKEVTYVEDASQGLLLNRMKDNWFITAEGGVNKTFGGFNNHRNFWNGCAPAFSIWGGKWFTSGHRCAFRCELPYDQIPWSECRTGGIL